MGDMAAMGAISVRLTVLLALVLVEVIVRLFLLSWEGGRGVRLVSAEDWSRFLSLGLVTEF